MCVCFNRIVSVVMTGKKILKYTALWYRRLSVYFGAVKKHKYIAKKNQKKLPRHRQMWFNAPYQWRSDSCWSRGWVITPELVPCSWDLAPSQLMVTVRFGQLNVVNCGGEQTLIECGWRSTTGVSVNRLFIRWWGLVARGEKGKIIRYHEKLIIYLKRIRCF